jgi:hypothetical protein
MLIAYAYIIVEYIHEAHMEDWNMSAKWRAHEICSILMGYKLKIFLLKL